MLSAGVRCGLIAEGSSLPFLISSLLSPFLLHSPPRSEPELSENRGSAAREAGPAPDDEDEVKWAKVTRNPGRSVDEPVLDTNQTKKPKVSQETRRSRDARRV
jgi:hypothetical protein